MDLLEKPTEINDAMHITLEPCVTSGNDVLSVRELAKSFDGMTLFTDLNFEVKRGERIAIIGNNGTGKTTIRKMINGLLTPDNGEIRLGSKVHIGYYDQEHQVLHMDKTLFQEIQDTYPIMNNTQIRNTLAAFLFTGDDVFKLIRDLSGGERGRVSLAKLMLSEANFLILDEPTAGLDPKERIRIRNLISDLSQDRIVLIATHVVSDIEFISKEILLMKNGRLIDKASPEQLQAKIQGKVFEMSVGQQELEEVKEKFEISNLFRKDGQIIVRVVTQKRPEGYNEIREAAPTLEDVYLYEFEVKGAMHK